MRHDEALQGAIDLLIQGWRDAVADAIKIESALERLGVSVPSVDAVRAEAGLAVPPQPPSIRSLVVALLEEGDRDWSAVDIMKEFDARGLELRSRDPANAVRAGLVEATKAGEIVRVAYGRYKSAAYVTQGDIFKNEPGLAEAEEAAAG